MIPKVLTETREAQAGKKISDLFTSARCWNPGGSCSRGDLVSIVLWEARWLLRVFSGLLVCFLVYRLEREDQDDETDQGDLINGEMTESGMADLKTGWNEVKLVMLL